MNAQPEERHGDCSETILRLYEYLDGEMTDGDTRRIAIHLAECAPCMAQHDLEQAMKALVRRSCGSEAAPARLRTSIMTSITEIHIQRF